MDATALTALIGALAGLVTAITALIAVIRHATGPKHANGQGPGN